MGVTKRGFTRNLQRNLNGMESIFAEEKSVLVPDIGIRVYCAVRYSILCTQVYSVEYIRTSKQALLVFQSAFESSSRAYELPTWLCIAFVKLDGEKKRESEEGELEEEDPLRTCQLEM